MRSEHPTVGCVADGTGTLEPMPVTEQDTTVTEDEQSCVNSAEGLPSTVSEDPDTIDRREEHMGGGLTPARGRDGWRGLGCLGGEMR